MKELKPYISCKWCGHTIRRNMTDFYPANKCVPCFELELGIKQQPEVARKILNTLKVLQMLSDKEINVYVMGED